MAANTKEVMRKAMQTAKAQLSRAPKPKAKTTKPAQQEAPTDAPSWAPEAIYLMDTGEGIDWCADPAPGEGMYATDAVRYVRYAPAQDAERERDTGIEAAARWIEKRRDDFDREHGYEDPDTGAWEYGTGVHAEAKREYSWELVEIAEGLRALKSDAARAQRAAAQEDA